MSRAEVDNALIILQADDVKLARDVLAGWETLSRAAKSIRPRVRLIGAYTVATPADRIALSQAVGPDAIDTITAALGATPRRPGVGLRAGASTQTIEGATHVHPDRYA